MDEAITTGIASHPLSAIPGILRHDGSPPLFYLLLHFWMQRVRRQRVGHARAVAAVRTADHPGRYCGPAGACSAAAPACTWRSLFAFSTFLTAYAQETRMYELMGLLGILATAAFLHGFVYRRRGYLILFAVCQALMLYTHAWGLFFGAGAVRRADPDLADQRRSPRAIVRDAVIAYVGAGVLFLPWLPNFIYQATHTGAPWAPTPRSARRSCSRATCSAATGSRSRCWSRGSSGWRRCSPSVYRRTRDGTIMWSLIWLIAGDADHRLARLADHARRSWRATSRRSLRGDPAAGGAGARRARASSAWWRSRCRSCSWCTRPPTRRSTRATCRTSAAR